MIPFRQGVKGREFFDYLFDRQALLYYLADYPRDREVMLLLFEMEDLDEWFSIYAPNIVTKAGEEILGVINEILPLGAKFFQISDDKYCILFGEVDARRGIEFAHILKTLIIERKSCTNLSEVDVTISSGLVIGGADIIMPKAFSAIKCAKKLFSKVYFLDINDEIFKEQQSKEIEYNALIKNAVQSGNIIPFYQPIFDNALQKVTKFECLARLLDEKNDRVLYPFDFLEQVRRMGFMRSITYSIINHSFQTFSKNNFEFSINITEEDIRDTQMIDYIRNRCKKHGINPKRIIIELLEDIEFDDDDLIINNILILKDMGFKIAVDDFGYANSNFGRLIKMQIDYIKIDGRFIKNMDANPISHKIVRSVTEFARNIGVQCIAEHVHSKVTQNLTQNLGIEFSQGFFIGEAISNPITKGA
ncbi:EAL domain-containing protein [Helicobacter sp. 23-1045]